MQSDYGRRQNEFGGYSRQTIHHEPHHDVNQYYQPPGYNQQHWNNHRYDIVQTNRLTERNYQGSDLYDNQRYQHNPYHNDSNHNTLSNHYTKCESSNQTSTNALTSESIGIHNVYERSSGNNIGKDMVWSSMKVEGHTNSSSQYKYNCNSKAGIPQTGAHICDRTSKRRITNSTVESGSRHEASTGYGDGDSDSSALSLANQPIPKKPRASFGMKMLTKMGWKPDTGLGKREDGMRTALEVVMKDDSTGLGFARESIWELPQWGEAASGNEGNGSVDIEEIPWQLWQFNRENRRRAKHNRQGGRSFGIDQSR